MEIPEAYAVQYFKAQHKNDCESWLVDSGASSHLKNDCTYFKRCKKVHVAVRVSNGDTVTAKVRGCRIESGKGTEDDPT